MLAPKNFRLIQGVHVNDVGPRQHFWPKFPKTCWPRKFSRHIFSPKNRLTQRAHVNDVGPGQHFWPKFPRSCWPLENFWPNSRGPCKQCWPAPTFLPQIPKTMLAPKSFSHMSTQCWPMLARANIYPDFGLSMLAVEKVGSFPPPFTRYQSPFEK